MLEVRRRNCLYLSKHADILRWWKDNACYHRLLVICIAAPVLAKPEANSLQERVFSCAGLIDTNLRQNLGNEKFEMLSVLAFNKAFIQSRDFNGLVHSLQSFLQSLIASLTSAASASQAAETIIKFYGFDLDQDDDAENHRIEGNQLGKILRQAASDLERKNTKKRSHSLYSINNK